MTVTIDTETSWHCTEHEMTHKVIRQIAREIDGQQRQQAQHDSKVSKLICVACCERHSEHLLCCSCHQALCSVYSCVSDGDVEELLLLQLIPRASSAMVELSTITDLYCCKAVSAATSALLPNAVCNLLRSSTSGSGHRQPVSQSDTQMIAV